ncbi:MAG TPA: phosphatidylserine/phosphatidylglycerophosphate/cardiolipin synthase family protein [Gaiellaceae bacterium]|jgi:phosphatidylserine/phosphatidylglycerophosphate/cardiolipin synthase-like enzyme
MWNRADAFVGDRLEGAVRAHHRRRLRRTGWARALDPPRNAWAEGGSPPREGNALEVLVDGANALPAIAEAIAGARDHVHLAGWYFSPDFQLEDRGATLRELLAETAERVDVRVLAWAGAPLPLFHPDRKEVRKTFELLAGGTRIRYGLDSKERPMHCHHEKLVIVDGELAFVGGIDLTSLAGDRFDTSDHQARGSTGWHDATARVRGPIVGDVADHFALRWHEVTGERLSPQPSLSSAGPSTVQLVRTVPEHVYDALPDGDFGIVESYLSAIRGAERFVYLESQFLWSPEVVAELVAKLQRPPGDDFRVVVLLPSKPNNGRDDTRGQLGVLAEADGGGNCFLACTLVQPGALPPQGVYVHAKIGIVDDRWLTLGSANLNEHSLFNDTEVNVVTDDAEVATAVRKRLWAEHLECDEDELGAPVHELVDERWRPLAEETLQRIQAGEAPERKLARLPHVSRRSRRLLGPLDGLLVDG